MRRRKRTDVGVVELVGVEVVEMLEGTLFLERTCGGRWRVLLSAVVCIADTRIGLGIACSPWKPGVPATER